MKINKFNIKTLLLIFVVGLLLFNACKDNEEVFPRTRLFQPVLNEDLEAFDNTIHVNLAKLKQAENYTIEVSRDSFATEPIYSFAVDTNEFIIDESVIGEELLWFTIYQVRATAHADEAQYNSLPSLLGSIRTDKFPSNQGAPGLFDVTDTRARVFWTPSGAPITAVKVYSIEDERLANPLSTFDVTDEDREAQMKIVNGLEAETEYQMAIFSEGNLRGWEIYTTKVAQETGDHIIDLSGLEDGFVLADTLADVADGSVIRLEGGKTYEAGGYAFDKSISFIAGYSFTPALPIIDCGSNFNIVEGSNVSYVTFKSVKLTAADGFGGRYVFNIDVSGSVGEIKFESCEIRTLRGISRIKGGEGVLDKFTIDNCVIDSINGYGVLAVDKNSWKCNDISITNSTLSKVIYFLVSRNNSNSILIDACTLNEVPEKGRQLLRWRESGQDEVLNGVTISNSIIGHGWNKDGGEDYLIDGYDGMANTTFNVVNTYVTSDFGYGEGKDEIPGLTTFTYPGTAAELWTDPYFTLDFSFLDTGFSGKADSGDPRWRITL
jgi:hypothetical protein